MGRAGHELIAPAVLAAPVMCDKEAAIKQPAATQCIYGWAQWLLDKQVAKLACKHARAHMQALNASYYCCNLSEAPRRWLNTPAGQTQALSGTHT